MFILSLSALLACRRSLAASSSLAAESDDAPPAGPGGACDGLANFLRSKAAGSVVVSAAGAAPRSYSAGECKGQSKHQSASTHKDWIGGIWSYS